MSTDTLSYDVLENMCTNSLRILYMNIMKYVGSLRLLTKVAAVTGTVRPHIECYNLGDGKVLKIGFKYTPRMELPVYRHERSKELMEDFSRYLPLFFEKWKETNGGLIDEFKAADIPTELVADPYNVLNFMLVCQSDMQPVSPGRIIVETEIVSL